MPLFQIVLNLPFLIVGFIVKTLFFVKKGMGKNYVLGLWEGIQLSLSPEGKRHKQKFNMKRMGNYVAIQLLLWRNMLRLFE